MMSIVIKTENNKEAAITICWNKSGKKKWKQRISIEIIIANIVIDGNKLAICYFRRNFNAENKELLHKHEENRNIVTGALGNRFFAKQQNRF